MILGLNPDSVLGSWSSKHLQTTLFTVYLHDLGIKFRFSSWTLILQTTWFTAYLHDLGTTVNLDSVFGSWSFKKKDETNVYKCLQKPLIHDAKLISEILLFGSWSSKLPGLQEICMILGLNPDSVLGSLSSKHLQTTLFTVYLHDLGIKSRFSSRTLILQTTWFTAYLHDLGTTVNLDSVFGSWSFKKKDETNVYKCLQKPLIHDAKLILEILLFGSWSSKLPGLQEICMILGLNPDSVLGSLSSKNLQTTLFTVYLHDLGIKSRFSSRTLILQTTWFTAYLHDLGTTVNLDSVFRILILQKKGWNKCIQMSTKASNPRCEINFGNLTFRILVLQTTWFTGNLHDFGTKSRFSFGILILQKSPNHLVYSLFAWSWD